MEEGMNEFLTILIETVARKLQGIDQTDKEGFKHFSEFLCKIGSIAPNLVKLSDGAWDNLMTWDSDGAIKGIPLETLIELEKAGIILNGQLDRVTREVLAIWIDTLKQRAGLKAA